LPKIQSAMTVVSVCSTCTTCVTSCPVSSCWPCNRLTVGLCWTMTWRVKPPPPATKIPPTPFARKSSSSGSSLSFATWRRCFSTGTSSTLFARSLRRVIMMTRFHEIFVPVCKRSTRIWSCSFWPFWSTRPMRWPRMRRRRFGSFSRRRIVSSRDVPVLIFTVFRFRLFKNQFLGFGFGFAFEFN